jgi:rare lipoprotein A
VSIGLRTACAAALAAVLLQACGGPGPRDDGPPRDAAARELPPDAVPRTEPKSRYGNPASYVVLGQRYHVMGTAHGHVERGVASWYGNKFHGRRTSSGETYDMHLMTAAHRSLPLPSYVEVVNLENNRRVVVRVNDRGPFHANRIIDLSYSAARKLDIVRTGTGLVEIRALTPGLAPARVEPAPTLRPASVAPAPRLYLQAGAFSESGNAQRLRERIASLGGAAVRVHEAVVEGQRLFRVRLGPLSDVAQADRLSAQMVATGMDLPQIVIE